MARRRKLVAGIAAVVLVAGVATGVALAHNRVGASTAPRLVEGKSMLVAAAAYLGVPPRTLRRELRPGHPLAAIAGSTPGRTVGGLEAALFHDAIHTFGVIRLNFPRLHQRIAGFVAGLCPLHMSAVALRLGTCPGMSMR